MDSNMGLSILHHRISKQFIHQAAVLTKLFKNMERLPGSPTVYQTVTKIQHKIPSRTTHVLAYLGKFIIAEVGKLTRR